MKNANLFLIALVAAFPARAEFRQIDLTIYGMD
jgi:hypothetical protein